MAKTAVLSIKIDPKVKKEAEKVAEELGFSISAIVNASLKNLSRTKSISYSIPEIPNAKLRKIIKQAEKDYKKGDYYGPFTLEESEAFLKSL